MKLKKSFTSCYRYNLLAERTRMKIKNEEKASGISKEGGHGESGDHKEKERG